MGGLVEAAGKARIGPGLDPATQLGPLISAEQRERVCGYIERGKSEGAELLTGGASLEGDASLVEPTLFSTTRDDLTIARGGDLRPRSGGAPVRLHRGGRPPRQRH